MKIPAEWNGVERRTGNGDIGQARRSPASARSGADAFREILETRMTSTGGALSGGGPADIPDEKTIRQLIEIIRIRMMLDEHMLESMRDGGGDGSLYQRFARWHLGGINAMAAPAEPVKPVREEPVEKITEDVPSVVRVRRTSDRSQPYEPIIRQASKTYGVEPELIRAVIRAESNFKNESISPKGAMGLMQIMPATAKDLGIRDAYDAQENIMGGTRYLKSLLDRYQGDVPTALAAYNWGMGNVERRPEKLPRETRDYINRIRHYMDEGKA